MSKNNPPRPGEYELFLDPTMRPRRVEYELHENYIHWHMGEVFKGSPRAT